MPRRIVTPEMRQRMARNKQQALMDAGAGPAVGPKHHAGERVVSIAGWTGTVTAVVKRPGATGYQVRWDKSGDTGYVPAQMLKP
jgi:hypothetical protein